MVSFPGLTHLEEPLQPPHLEEALPNQHHELEDAPPLDARVCALGGVPVCSLADDNVALLVFDLRNKFRHLFDCIVISMRIYMCFCSRTLFLQWVLWCIRLGYVDDAVDVE